MLDGVRLFLIRHAKAQKGFEQAKRLGVTLSLHPTPPAVVLTSPLLRARQTAEAVADATRAELRVDDRLGPGATADSLRTALAGLEGPVAAVGHQPDCSEIALALTGADPGFPTAGMLELEL
jgi:phosphohistidine phosphatase SixA